MSEKDRITCHVLDTQAGRPARGVRVRLEGPLPARSESASSSSAASNHVSATSSPAAAPAPQHLKTFESLTDEDGRVKTWLPYSGAHASGEVPVYTLDDVLGELGGRASTWTLTFDTAAYFGGEDKTFFPEVLVRFMLGGEGHYHVPLLLSPYSYTTYRGS